MDTPNQSTSVFDFHGRPSLARALPLSLQHILAMIMGTVTVPIIVVGATVIVFGMITMTGIQLITKDELSARNVTIVSLSLALSMGIYAVPEAIARFPETLRLVIGGSPIVVAAAVSFTLNLILPKKSLSDEEEERRQIEASMDQ